MNNAQPSSGFIAKKGLTDEDVITSIRKLHASSSGFNELWECRRLGKFHILKALQPLYVNNPLYEKLLQKEFDISYKLEHVHICRTLGWEKHHTLGNCILMEYIDGETLESYLKNGKLTLSLAIKFINELCDALQYIHKKQVIHRDLKPGNILITHNGNNVKLIDFGLSDCDDYHILKIPAGTRMYIAPEQMKEDVQIDVRVDIYSLGVIISEMAALLHNRHLSEVALKCMQPNREKRYFSAYEVKKAVNKKSYQKTYLAATASGLMVVLASLLFLFNGTPKQTSPETPSAGVFYNNSVLSNHSQQLLLNERIELLYNADSMQKNDVPVEEDSIRLMNKLKEALHERYPLAAQRRTPVYQKELTDMQKYVSTIITEVYKLKD